MDKNIETITHGLERIARQGRYLPSGPPPTETQRDLVYDTVNTILEN